MLKQLQNIPYCQPQGKCTSGLSSATKQAVAAESERTGSTSAPEGLAAKGLAEDAVHSPISPVDDKMYYFRHLLSQPPLVGVEQLTVQDLAIDYCATVHALALQLHLLESTSGPGRYNAAALDRIKAILDRHFTILKTLVLLQRSELVEAFVLTNFETLEVIDEYNADKHLWIIEAVGVTAEQRASVAHAVELCKRLIEPLMQERMQLQQQMAAAEQPEHGAAGYKQQLDLQARQLKRLSEHFTRFVLACWIFGTLSYVQIAALAVYSTPYPFSVILLGKMLHMQHMQHKQQSNMQQQKKQQVKKQQQP